MILKTKVRLEVTETNPTDNMIEVGDFVMADNDLFMIARIGYQKYTIIDVVTCNRQIDENHLLKFPMKTDALRRCFGDEYTSIRIVKSISLKVEVVL